jgi:hypothetical protein
LQFTVGGWQFLPGKSTSAIAFQKKSLILKQANVRIAVIAEND